MAGKPQSVDEYLDSLRPEQRAALVRLRDQIAAGAPEAVECIAYGMPAFRLHGKLFVTFAAAAKHCAFYPGAHPIRMHRRELEPYECAIGTIRFQPEEPLPAELIRSLVASRIAERSI